MFNKVRQNSRALHRERGQVHVFADVFCAKQDFPPQKWTSPHPGNERLRRQSKRRGCTYSPVAPTNTAAPRRRSTIAAREPSQPSDGDRSMGSSRRGSAPSSMVHCLCRRPKRLPSRRATATGRTTGGRGTDGEAADGGTSGGEGHSTLAATAVAAGLTGRKDTNRSRTSRAEASRFAVSLAIMSAITSANSVLRLRIQTTRVQGPQFAVCAGLVGHRAAGKRHLAGHCVVQCAAERIDVPGGRRIPRVADLVGRKIIGRSRDLAVARVRFGACCPTVRQAPDRKVSPLRRAKPARCPASRRDG